MRKLRRMVAHKNMKKRGIRKVNKGKNSFFSEYWRDYAK